MKGHRYLMIYSSLERGDQCKGIEYAVDKVHHTIMYNAHYNKYLGINTLMNPRFVINNIYRLFNEEDLSIDAHYNSDRFRWLVFAINRPKKEVKSLGAIYTTLKDFSQWYFGGKWGHLKSSKESIYYYIYGTCDDYEGVSNYGMFFRRSIINGLKSGKYNIDIDKSVNGEIVINDEHGNPIPQVKEGYCY